MPRSVRVEFDKNQIALEREYKPNRQEFCYPSKS